MPSDRCPAYDEYVQLSMYIPDKVNKCIGLLAEHYLKDTSLKTYYVPYIIHIKNIDGISQKELKVLIPFDKSRISVVVHELIEKGLVYNDGVGRNNSLHLTEHGKEIYPVCKMFFDLIKKEIFLVEDDVEEIVRAKTIEFNNHLDDLIQKYS